MQPFMSITPVHAAHSTLNSASALPTLILPLASRKLLFPYRRRAAAAVEAVVFWLPPMNTLPRLPIRLPLKQTDDGWTVDFGRQRSMRFRFGML